jgi:hypothetical protein
MNCEQFLFEASYLLESGEAANLGMEALAHADQCPRCQARFYRLKRQSTETKEFTPLMSQRLHQTIDLVIVQRRPSPKMWLQVAFTCVVLVGSLVGIAYQNHPTTTPPAFARR